MPDWRAPPSAPDRGWRAPFHCGRRGSDRDQRRVLGDYIRLLAVGKHFYGVFSGSNEPNRANFPSGITYLRNVDWDNHRLLGVDNVTPVPVSIDPFFVHRSP